MSDVEAAASYWAARKVGAFSRDRPWSSVLADRIAELDPRSVFEFGCNVGRHLRVLRERIEDPDVRLMGLDISLPAVHQARRDLDVLLGDERTLALLPTRSFDVAFTVSVIDHLPDPRMALHQLDRIASTLVLVEPWLGRETQLADQGTSPWTYSWDYPERLPERTWTIEDFPLHGAGAGPHYRLHIGT